jgi:alpha-tubulin suppressor-like RCC1 family protein
MKYLLLVDSHLRDVHFLLSTVTSDVTYVLVDSKKDTPDAILKKIPQDTYSRVGIVQENSFIETYQWVESLGSSVLKDASILDPTLESWLPMIHLLQRLKDFGMEHLDFIECNLGTPDWLFITQSLEQRLNIVIHHSTGVIGEGGSWTLDNDPEILTDDIVLVGLYFTENVRYYPYALGTSGGSVEYNNFRGAMHIINTSHHIYSWGTNWFGCFGIGNISINQQFWTYTQTPPSSFPSNPIAIDGSAMHTVVCLQNGTVYGMGMNVDGQTGTLTGYGWGPNQSQWYSPVIVPGITNAVDVACGDSHTLVLTSNGDVYGFGYNYYGQLAIQSSIANSVAYNNFSGAVVKCILPEKIKGIYANLQASVFLGASGSLYVAGDNYNGFIGLGSTPNTTSAVKVSNTLFKTASVGFYFTLALDLNGNIWGTGQNETYQLGTGNTIGYTTFQQITSSTVYKSISAGYMHAGSTDTENRLWMWGNNQYGPLGNGTNTNVTIPTRSNMTIPSLSSQYVVPSIIMTGYRFTIIGVFHGNNIVMCSSGLNTASRLRNIYDDAYQAWTFTVMDGSSFLYVLPAPEPAFTYLNEVSIQSIQPSSGTTNTPVLLSGENLDKVTSAFYGVNPATYTLNSSTSISLTTPAGSGNVSVSLVHPGGTLYSPTVFTYANPSINSMSPSSAPSNSVIEVRGVNLSNTSSVRFNTSASSFVNTSVGLNVTVPVGTGNVSVFVTDTYENTVSASERFSFLNPSITQITAGASRSSVTITGTNLLQVSSVKFNQTPVSFVRISDTALNVSVPVGSNTTPVTVTDSYQNTALTTFTYANPSINSMSPSSAPSGSVIEVRGANLSNTSSVRFNTSASSFVNTSVGLNVTVPVGTGNASVFVTDTYGNEVNAGIFTYPTVPIIEPSISLYPNKAVAQYPVMITDTGSRFSNEVSVYFGGVSARHVFLSTTKMIVYVPEITSPCPITIVLSSGNITTELFTPIIPSFQSISTTEGQMGETVTLYGSNLASIDYVLFDKYNAEIIVPNGSIRTNNSITCVLPYGVGTTQIYLKDKYGNSLFASNFTYISEVSTFKELSETPIAVSHDISNHLLYVSMGTHITVIPSDGTNNLVIELPGSMQITGIAVHNGKIYMAVPGSNTQSIWTYNISSKTFSSFYSWNGAVIPQVVKIYKDKLYVISNATSETSDTIHVLNLNGAVLYLRNYSGVWLKGIGFYLDFIFVSITSKYTSSLIGKIWKLDLSATILDSNFISDINNPIDLTCVGNYLFIDGPTILQYNIENPTEPVATYSTPESNYNAIVQGLNDNLEPVLYISNISNNTLESIVSPPTTTSEISFSTITPSYGPAKTRVKITGENFLSGINQSRIQSIQFNGIPATGVSVVSSTQLYCDVPAGTGSATLKIIDSYNRELVTTLSFEYENPVLTSYFPREGSENDEMVIEGLHLDQVIDVLIGENSVKEIVSVSEDFTEMTVKIPAGFSSNRVRLIDSNNNRIDNTAIDYTFNYLGSIEGYFNDGYYQSMSVFYKTVRLNQVTMPNFRLDLTADRVVGSVGFGYVFYSDEHFTEQIGQSPTWSIVQGVNPFQIVTEKMYAIGKLSFLPGSRVDFSSFKINGIDQIRAGTGSLTINVPPLSFVESKVGEYQYYSMPFNHITDPSFKIEIISQPTTGSVFFGYVHETSSTMTTVVSKTFISSGKYVIPHGNITQDSVMGRFMLAPGSRITLSSFKVNGVEQLLKGPITFQSQSQTKSVLRSAICFPSDTYVKTDQGKVEIQNLDPTIHTLQGKTIVAITDTYCIDDELVLIEKDALRKNYPTQDTLISKRHKIYYRGKMKAAQRLVGKYKGVSFVPYKGEKLYNVLLEEYGRMSVHGMLCETLHPANPIAKLFIKKI